MDDYTKIEFMVNKNMTPDKFKNNDNSVGLGTDYESFRLNEHLLEICKYYGIESLKDFIKEYENVLFRYIF